MMASLTHKLIQSYTQFVYLTSRQAWQLQGWHMSYKRGWLSGRVARSPSAECKPGSEIGWPTAEIHNDLVCCLLFAALAALYLPDWLTVMHIGCYGSRAFQTKPYLIFLPDLQTYLIYLRIWPTYLTNYYNLQNPDISDIGTNQTFKTWSGQTGTTHLAFLVFLQDRHTWHTIEIGQFCIRGTFNYDHNSWSFGLKRKKKDILAFSGPYHMILLHYFVWEPNMAQNYSHFPRCWPWKRVFLVLLSVQCALHNVWAVCLPRNRTSWDISWNLCFDIPFNMYLSQLVRLRGKYIFFIFVIFKL